MVLSLDVVVARLGRVERLVAAATWAALLGCASTPEGTLRSTVVPSLPPQRDAGGRTYLAVAEDVVQDQLDHPHLTAIRVSFEKVGTDWNPVASPPSRLSWSVCLGGRRLAALDSRLPERPPESLRFRTAHEVGPGQKVPFVGMRSMQFAGWMGSEVFRPMALTSGPSCGDPEHWRSAAPPASIVENLMPAMREVAKGIYDCDSHGGQRIYRFPDTDIQAVSGFVSDPGARIVSLAIRLPEDLAARCGVITGAGWQPHTFVVFPGGEVEHLGFGMTFVDAGDYDGDGHSEVLFQSSSYNGDGYTLAYDSFRKSAHLGWSYH